MTQISLSLRLNEEDFRLVMHALQELIHASSLEDLTRGTMKIEQDHSRHNLSLQDFTFLYSLIYQRLISCLSDDFQFRLFPVNDLLDRLLKLLLIPS